MTENKQFKVIETITHDDRRIYELTKNDIGYYNFKGEKLLAHLICNELNGLIEKNKVLYKEIGRLKTQNNDLLFSNAKNMESLEKENKQLKSDNNRLVNETAKIIAEHQGRVFEIIDERINEYIYTEKLYKHKGKDREASVFNLYCLCLNNLKKELQE